jgi:hypothetical protein
MTTPDLVERLRGACEGHPNAEIPWPHRLLHEAIAEIERLSRSRNDVISECAIAAYSCPAYVLGRLETDEDGVLMPGSPYDRGRYDAYRAIRAMLARPAPIAQKEEAE